MLEPGAWPRGLGPAQRVLPRVGASSRASAGGADRRWSSGLAPCALMKRRGPERRDHEIRRREIRRQRNVMDVAHAKQRPDVRVVRLRRQWIHEEEHRGHGTRGDQGSRPRAASVSTTPSLRGSLSRRLHCGVLNLQRRVTKTWAQGSDASAVHAGSDIRGLVAARAPGRPF